MKHALILALSLPLALAACGTPQQNCIAGQTRDLRVVDRLIVETQQNLSRGYALEEVTVLRPQWVQCYPRAATPGNPTPPPRMCMRNRPDTVTRPQAIDLDAEARKLASLQTKRAQLARAAAPAIAQCRALHPE
ncbi:hypothetical protein RNZ50_18920 [Paracoccaceae bacterium Fryx2]|nr:hypothetical protein [Paracoccaceae bacterium Fryx2]